VLAAVLIVRIHVATIGSAAAGACRGAAITGSTADELRPLVWIVVALVLPPPASVSTRSSPT
jgi:hypothetical protein